MKVLCPAAKLSEAPTRVKIRSTSPMRASVAGTKLPICAKQDDQRDLAEVGAFPRHVGSGEDHKPVALTVEERVVGYEGQIAAELFDDRVSAFPNEDRAALIDEGFDVAM